MPVTQHSSSEIFEKMFFPVTVKKSVAQVRTMSSFHWGTASGVARIDLEDETLRDGVCLRSARNARVQGIGLTAVMPLSFQVNSWKRGWHCRFLLPSYKRRESLISTSVRKGRF